MYWQADDNFTFRLVGGKLLVPGQDGRHSDHISVFTGSEAFLENTSYGGGVPPPPTLATLVALRSSIARWRPDLVVVVKRGLAPGWGIGMYYEALGRPPALVNGAYVWANVVPDLASHKAFVVPAAAFAACVGDGQAPSLITAVAGCIARAEAAATARHHRRHPGGRAASQT
jgi:hypothetical protein